MLQGIVWYAALRLKPLKTAGYSGYTLVPIEFFIEKNMDDDWASNFLEFFKLPPEEMKKRLREMFERTHVEWQENPEPGLVLRPIVQERLLRQLLAVKDGERGTPLEEFFSFRTDWWEDPVREIQILRNASTQLMGFHPDLAWLVLEQIYRLRPKKNLSLERLKGGMVGIFKHKWQDYRILCMPLPHDVLLICDISRASDLFEPARASLPDRKPASAVAACASPTLMLPRLRIPDVFKNQKPVSLPCAMLRLARIHGTFIWLKNRPIRNSRTA